MSRLPEGSVGRAYLNFTTSENISAQGLIEESRKGIDETIDSAHPYAWYGRRLRDIHTAGQHTTFAADRIADDGKALLGLPVPNSPLISVPR